MIKLAIDAMGGDHAPKAIVEGAAEAVLHFPDIEVILVGNEGEIRPHLKTEERISILHTEEKILSEDEPVRSVRRKKDASMVMAAREVAEGRADACISAGNTGALVAAGLFLVGRLPGIHRPALAPTFPTIDGKGFLLLDVGANSDAKPEHLLQYAYMGSIYAEKVRGIRRPTVGLLNIGTEAQKGNDLARKAYSLLLDSDLNFVGNVEARDLLTGVADVAVTDGFTGNMVLKTMEGTALSLFRMLKETLMSNWKSKLAAGFIKKDLKQIQNKMDYSSYGGAALFGLASPVVKAHGSSDARAVFHAIRQAKEMVENGIVDRIRDSMEQMSKTI
jgi:phosphate:acyl-[acyl carrier protein] acyltransferase